MFFWLTAMLLAVAPVAADEKTRADDSSTASSPAADKPVVPETVELLDGADSAEGALTAFLAASKAADDQAALLMVDPPIRRLLIPEIAIEKFAMDSVLIEHALFGEEKNAVGGILFCYAQRDLINIQGAKIINTRNIDDDRVIFTIDSTALSYDHDGTNRTVEEIMAIRRLGKWHVFKPFGIMTMAFLNVASYQIETGPLLKEKRGTTESPNRLNADFELQFAVPFESVHAELVRCSESPETAECILLANRLERLKDSIVNRAKRGNYKTREDLKHAFGQADSFAEEIVTKQAEAFQPLLKNLTKKHLIKSENPANK